MRQKSKVVKSLIKSICNFVFFPNFDLLTIRCSTSFSGFFSILKLEWKKFFPFFRPSGPSVGETLAIYQKRIHKLPLADIFQTTFTETITSDKEAKNNLLLREKKPDRKERISK